MNALSIIGSVLLLLNALFVHCDNPQWSISSKNSNGQLKFLCGLFPALLKDKCQESLSNKVAVVANVNVDVHLNSGVQSGELFESKKDVCSICKHVISKLELVIDNQKKPADIQKRFLGVCDIYKKPVKKQCVSFYNGLGLQVIRAVLKSEDPKKVCQIVKLCSAMNAIKEHLEILENLSDPIESGERRCPCLICILKIKWLESHIDTSQHAIDVHRKFLGYCEIYKAPVQTVCQYFFYTRGYRMIEDVLRKKQPKKICQYLHHCSTKESKVEPLNPIIGKTMSIDRKASNQPCEICKNVVMVYELIINKSLSAVYVQHQLLGACDLYKEPIKSQCHTFYNGVGLEIIQAILYSISPEIICQHMHLCLNADGKVPYLKFLELIWSLSQTSKQSCNICIAYMNFTEEGIDNSKSTEDFVNTIVNVCGIYKAPIKRYCQSFYNGLGAFIIMALQHKENPRKMCKYLHHCDASDVGEKVSGLEPESKLSALMEIVKSLLKRESIKGMFQENAAKSAIRNEDETKEIIKKSMRNPVECYLCKEIMEELKKILNGKNSKEEIQEALLKVCDAVPAQWRNGCDDFVRKYSNEIVDLLIRNINDERACASLNLCSIKDDTLYFLPENQNLFI